MKSTSFISAILTVMVILTLSAPAARAHCDTMDGPVIIEAQTALDKADITPVLKWVKPEAEAEVRAAFDHALKVRKLGMEAQQLADSYFFETLVRVHRAGEGAPYTGVKPAGQQEEIVMAADKALESGSAEKVIQQVAGAVQQGIEQRFHKAYETKQHAAHNVDAGREFVAAYVEFMHYVERLHTDAAAGTGHAHGDIQKAEAAPAGGGCGHLHN